MVLSITKHNCCEVENHDIYLFFIPTDLAKVMFSDRVGSAYDDRRFVDERFPRDSTYSRGTFHRDVERDNHAVPPPAGQWSQARRRSYEEEYPLESEPRRHAKSYPEPYYEMDSFREGHRYKQTSRMEMLIS